MNRHAREIRKQFIHLVWPVIIQNFLHMLMFNIDTAMVGRLNPVALAAMGIVGPVNWTIMMVAMGLSVGTVATVARSWGEKNMEKTVAFAATSYLMGILVSLIVSALVVPLCFKIGGVFIDDSDVIRESGRYLRIIYIFFIFTNISLVTSSILQAAGDTKTPMVINGFCNMLNVLGNYVLIFGKWGFPSLGLFGAGLSTGICKAIEAVLMTIFLFSPLSRIRLRWASFRMVSKKYIRDLLKVSIPASTEPFFVQSGFLVFTKIVAGLGTFAMAANRIALAVESLSFMPGHAFSTACATIVGQKYGERSARGIKLAVRQSMKVSLTVMSAIGASFLIMPGLLSRIFTDDVKLINLASICLMIGAAEQPFIAMVQILKGTFQGTGDTKRPIIYGSIGVWIPRLFLAYFLAIYFKMGLAGIWIATTGDWMVRAALYYLGYKRKLRHLYEVLRGKPCPAPAAARAVEECPTDFGD